MTVELEVLRALRAHQASVALLIAALEVRSSEAVRLEAEASGPSDQGSEMLSVADVAEALRVSTDYVRDAIRAGQLSAYKLGRSWRIRRDELAAFVASCRTRGGISEVSIGEPDTPPVAVTVSDAARALKVTQEGVRRMIQAGRLEGTTAGSVEAVTERSLNAHEQRRQETLAAFEDPSNLTIRDAAKRLDEAPMYVRELVERGQLKAIRRDGASGPVTRDSEVRIPARVVEAMLKRRQGKDERPDFEGESEVLAFPKAPGA